MRIASRFADQNELLRNAGACKGLRRYCAALMRRSERLSRIRPMARRRGAPIAWGVGGFGPAPAIVARKTSVDPSIVIPSSLNPHSEPMRFASRRSRSSVIAFMGGVSLRLDHPRREVAFESIRCAIGVDVEIGVL